VNKNGFRTLGLCFIIGMALFAVLISYGVRSVKKMDEYVTVKGLSEREVNADLAIWPITFTVYEDDLARLQNQIQSTRKIIYDFLSEGGFEQVEISNAPPQISDSQTNYTNESMKKPFRYYASITILLRSFKV
jgi:uncharacterized protein